MLLLDHFDDKLNNILKIKEDYYDEACMLIYVYIEYLALFSDRKFNDSYHNKENFRHFIMNYSGKAQILKYIQIDRFLNHCNTSERINKKFGHYLDPYREKLDLIRKGGELRITDFFMIDEVDERDRKFFRNYTIANRIYELRNFAVHEYRNKLYEGLDSNEPLLIFVNNANESQQGWFSILYPFEFIYEILFNCYTNIRTNYKELFGGY